MQQSTEDNTSEFEQVKTSETKSHFYQSVASGIGNKTLH